MREVFEEWLRENARKSNGDKYSDSSIYKYSSSIDVLNKEFNINLWNFNSIKELFDKKNKLFNNNKFIIKNTVGKNMYSRSVELFIEYICDINIKKSEKEIINIENDKELSLDEKNNYIETLLNVRNPQIQKYFRNGLIKEFNGKCALCGINDKRLLIASHIIPYSECKIKSDLYSSYNGLLLCSNHDSLFDKHLITFDTDGNIKISSSIDKDIYDFLDINDKVKLENNILCNERIEKLKKHYEFFFRKESKNE